jgi:hypothetical protein
MRRDGHTVGDFVNNVQLLKLKQLSSVICANLSTSNHVLHCHMVMEQGFITFVHFKSGKPSFMKQNLYRKLVIDHLALKNFSVSMPAFC